MQCTPEQIEAKRKQALQKLAEKKLKTSPLSAKLKGNSSPVSSNYFKIRNNQNENVIHYKPYNKPFGASANKSAAPSNIKSPNQDVISLINKQSTSCVNSTLNVLEKSKVVNGTVILESVDRFSVKFSAYFEPAIKVMNAISSKVYDPQTRIWSFSIKDYELFQSKMKQLEPHLILDKLPHFVLKCCTSDDSNNIEDLANCNIDKELLSALMPFQKEGVCFGINKNGRCLIADDMGVGKTFQALAIADYYKEDWPLLIVTTTSMKNVWESTIHKYLTSVPIMDVQYMVSSRDYIDSTKILIISRDLLSRCIDKLKNRGFGVLIIDESHVLKNFKAKCTQAAIDLGKRARRIILLTGTPALSRPSELYTQLALIDDRFFGSFYDYSKRYCDGKTSRFGWDATGHSNLKELEIVLHKKFMIRRTKETVLKNLPKKTEEVIKLDVNLNQFSSDERNYLLALSDKYNAVNEKNKHAALILFFAETAKIKVPSVCSYIIETLEKNRKFLVFAHHQVILNAIEKVLKKHYKKYIRIDGSTMSEQRKYLVDKFQYDDEYICAVLSITAANAGITLTAASLVIFAELHWNPSILSQAEARAHRLGQQEAVTIQYLIAPGTADDAMWILLKDKQKTLKDLGLLRESYKNVEMKNQTNTKLPNIEQTSTTTHLNTLDISTYFESPQKDNKKETSMSFEEELLNDDMDDIFGAVELDF